MVSINYSSREVCCKIVYYGPGLSGKTTNLQYVHAKVPQQTRGKLISLATEADRTLYFDFLPINIGTINGFSAKFQLYTVPGQVYYNATRKLVLRGVDGIVFVADSQTDKMDENMESLLNLEENLAEYGYNIADIPVAIQYNKRDLPNIMSVEQLNAQLNKRSWPHFEASASIGNGVFDTLKLIIKLVLERAKSSAASRPRPAASETTSPGTTAPGEITARSSAAAASDSQRIAVTADSPDYRPYPGGATKVEHTAAATAVAEPPATAPAEPAPAPAAPTAAAPHSEITARRTVPPYVHPRPTGTVSMAPSLRRRDDTSRKKRGFFKRLFGMK